MKITSVGLIASLAITMMFCFSAGCKRPASEESEIESKEEYSILQFYEYEYRDKKSTQSYVLFKNAMEQGVDVVGLPIEGKNAGYVWLIARAKSRESIFVLPKSTNFAISDADLGELKKDVAFSPGVLKFIEENRH